jgi:catechol 2,3-dioxygenase-like lactoylglutathione lyase family enzyme
VVRGTFSPARAWRPTVGAPLARTLGGAFPIVAVLAAMKEYRMPILLDHMIVPSKNRVAAAKLLGQILGVPWAEQASIGPFSPVYVSTSLTLDFDEWTESVPKQHYCFKVEDDEFDAIFGRIKAAGLAYRSTPIGQDDHQVNYAFGGRLVYWRDPDEHAWEILTVSYARQSASHAAGAA